jgi:hypothetical protein
LQKGILSRKGGLMGKVVIEQDEMPRTSSPQMARIEFAVPEPVLKQALEIAEAEGWKPAELHRVIWLMGLNSYTEGSNKRLVNESLRKKKGGEE